MKSNRGQILPLTVVMILFMVFFWVTLINVGKLIKDRIQMQIAADTAVQSACAVRARVLNATGLLNSWLGIPVLGIGWPQMAWWPVPPHAMDQDVALQKMRDMKTGMGEIKKLFVRGSTKTDTAMAALEVILNGLTDLIGGAYDIHPPAKPDYADLQQKLIHTIITIQEDYLKTYGGGLAYQRAREVARLQGADDIYVPPSLFSLGLVRNHGPLWYLSTLHIWIEGKPFPAPLPSIPDPGHIEDDPATKRWYEQGPNFYRKAMRLYTFRRPGSSWNGPFPLGQSLLNIKMPYLYAVAAARTYNPDGPMFPSHGETEGAFGGYAAHTEYTRASSGWRVQLTPVNGLYEH